jgi:hypothetical protein
MAYGAHENLGTLTIYLVTQSHFNCFLDWDTFMISSNHN